MMLWPWSFSCQSEQMGQRGLPGEKKEEAKEEVEGSRRQVRSY